MKLEEIKTKIKEGAIVSWTEKKKGVVSKINEKGFLIGIYFYFWDDDFEIDSFENLPDNKEKVEKVKKLKINV